MTNLDGLANANAELNKTVDDLSKAGNEAELNKALTDELGSQEGVEPANKTPETQEPEGNNPEGEGRSQSEDDKTVHQKADSIKDLLANRNEARDAAAKAELDAQTKEQRIIELEAENERLKLSNKGEGDLYDPSTDDKPLTRAEVEKLLTEKLSSKEKQAAAEKSDIAEVDALKDNKNTPNAAEHKEEILAVMETFPNMKADAAYMLLRGAGKIPYDDASANSNAGKLNTGDRAKANLTRDVKPEDMSDEQLEKAAREEAAKGGI